MTFACIIPAMFLSELELAPNIVITSLFYLNRLWALAFICRHLLNNLYCIFLASGASILLHQLIPDQPSSGPGHSTPTTAPTLHFWPPKASILLSLAKFYQQLLNNLLGTTASQWENRMPPHCLVLQSHTPGLVPD